jgi:membrane protein required for colicin V production
MNWIDIILIVPLLWAIVVGYKDGIIAQLGGIAGLLLGVWLAFKYAAQVGAWLNAPEAICQVVGFLVVVLVVIVAVGLLGKLLGKLFDCVGLSIINKLGGVVLALIKMSLLLSVLIMGFDLVNRNTKWVEQSKLDDAKLYRPIEKVSSVVFPYLLDLNKDKNGK